MSACSQDCSPSHQANDRAWRVISRHGPLKLSRRHADDNESGPWPPPMPTGLPVPHIPTAMFANNAKQGRVGKTWPGE